VFGISREKLKGTEEQASRNKATHRKENSYRTAIEQNPLMLSVLRVNLPYAL
jgi:hypothetical protein